MAGPLQWCSTGSQRAAVSAFLFLFFLPTLLTGALALLVLILVLLLLLTLALRIALLLLLALLTRLIPVLLVLLVLLRVLVGTHLCISGVRQRIGAGDPTVGEPGLAARAQGDALRTQHRHMNKQFMTGRGNDIRMTHWSPASNAASEKRHHQRW